MQTPAPSSNIEIETSSELRSSEQAGRQEESSQKSKSGRKSSNTSIHWTFLLISSAILILAVVMNVRGEQEVLVPLLNIPLPGFCSFQKMFGVGCPGCGMTRCFISLGHGDLAAAWDYNAVGLLLFAVALSQPPLRITQLWRIYRGKQAIQFPFFTKWFLPVLPILLVAQWVLRLALSQI